MYNTIILVNKEPYCIWEPDLKERNLEYIKSIDPGYFDYILKLSTENTQEREDKYASIALKMAYFQATESLFSLIGALIQAPDCVYAWILKYSLGDLRDLVSRITQADPSIFTKLNIKISWKTISDIVYSYYMPNTEKSTKTKELFATFWQRLSNEYLDDNNIAEYNSLKHGFRIKPGGFGLKIGREHKYGVTPPETEMHVVGYSKYGSSFFSLERVADNANTNRSYRSRKKSVNWRIEKIALLLQLTTMSLRNILSCLRILNGQKASELQFFRPIEDADFEKPWSFSPGVTSLSMDRIIEDVWYKATTKEDLLTILSNKKSVISNEK